jgi:hypothetical protein
LTAVEDTEPSSSSTAAPGAAVRIDHALESLVARRAHALGLTDVIRLGRDDVPAARDRFVGVPVLLAPSGRFFVLRAHSHAAAARAVLTEAGVPFDLDHPDRTFGAEYGWAMIQAAGAEGLRVQVDRRPTAAQQAAIEDLLLFERMAGRRVEMHWGRPMTWSPERFEWEQNPRFVATTDLDEMRTLLRRGASIG